MPSNLSSFLMTLSDNPLALLFVLFIATFILEDLALGAGFYLVTQNVIDPISTGVILFSGILLGDIALYWVGYLSNRYAWAHRFSEKKIAKLAENFVHKHVFMTVFTARFIPGLRLPAYVAVGFFKESYKAFLLAAITAVVVWASAFFAVIYFSEYLGMKFPMLWQESFAVMLILLFFALPALIRALVKK